MVCTSRETSHITFWCGFLSLRGVVSSLLLEINKNGICSLFTGKYNFGVVPEWAGAFAPYFLTPPWDFLYERTAPTSGVIVCYPITDTSRFWMCQTICGMVLCQAFRSLLPLPPPPSRISSTLAPLIGRPDTQARVKASVSGVSLLQLSPFSLSSFTFSPRNDWYSGYTMEHLKPSFLNKMTRWLARKLSSFDHRTLPSKPLIFFFPSSSSLLVYSYVTIYNVNIL